MGVSLAVPGCLLVLISLKEPPSGTFRNILEPGAAQDLLEPFWNHLEALWNLLELPLEASGTLSGTFWELFPKTFWNLLGFSDMRLPLGLLTSFSVCVGCVLIQKVCLHL